MTLTPEMQIRKVEKEERRSIVLIAIELDRLSGAFAATGNKIVSKALWKESKRLKKAVGVLKQMETLRLDVQLRPHEYGSTETIAAINEALLQAGAEISELYMVDDIEHAG